MLRQKPANEAAVNRLMDYLIDLETIVETKLFKSKSPDELVDSWRVAKRTFSDVKALGIIEQSGDLIKFKYNGPKRLAALKILDYRLKKSKKQIHVPIPDFAAIGDKLETIADRLTQLTVQNERWLKTHKNSLISEDQQTVEQSLFQQQEQRQKDRVYLAGKIASGIYQDFKGLTITKTAISVTNDTIINITDDLLDKLN